MWFSYFEALVDYCVMIASKVELNHLKKRKKGEVELQF